MISQGRIRESDPRGKVTKAERDARKGKGEM
jgi:hypothetical protein